MGSMRGASKILNKELVAFVKVCSVFTLHGNSITYKDVLGCRDKLIQHLVQLCEVEIKKR